MSMKFLHAITDEDPELKKKIGCMTGGFQIFDRQNLNSGRRINGRGHKKITAAGPALSTSASMGREHGIGSPKMVLEKNLSKSFNENQRISMDLLTTSSSSTSCSSFSSIELRKTGQREVQDKSSKNISPKLKAPDSPNARRSLDFRDVVKESISRDSRNLLVKITPKEEVTNCSIKHRDSPRPIDIDESIRVLVKLKEPPWNFSQLKESPRPSFEQAHRFSYDGREASRQSLDSRENGRLQHKFRDLPRLSLDSRESSLKNPNFEPKPNSILKDFDRRDRKLRVSQDSSNELISPKRTSSVVAKLMGLEEMPSLSILTQDPYHEPKPKPLKAFEANKEDRPLRDPDLIMKPVCNSRVPIETAPWKKEKHHVPQKAKFGRREESVYSEIEKRLKELEFRQTNKDLRALKQILDAMQAKGLLEAKKIDQTTTRDNQNLKKFESPIIIIKPANSVKRSGATMEKTKGSVINRVAKDRISNASLISDRIDDYGSHKVRPSKLQVSSRPQNSGSSLKNSGSFSPRLQQKRVEAESKTQRSSDNKKPLESVSPRGKLRQKQARVQNNDEQLSKSNEISQRSDSSSILTSTADIEVSSAYRSVDNSSIFNQGNRSPSAKVARKAALIGKQKKSSIGLSGEISNMEFLTATPSPIISVLDASLHHDDLSPSPLKKNSNSPKVEKNQISNSSTEINKKKLRNIENLVQKLASLSSTDDKISSSTYHIASLWKIQNPDHRYISEILLASGLLFKDLNFQPISQINPELFLVLEQTKTSKPKNDQDKIHRNLVFDLVNEALIQKMELTSSGKFPSGQKLLKELCLEFDQLQAKSWDETCDDEIKAIFHRSEGWENFEKEKQGFVLEIKRSIFKDLIDEVVSGEIACCSQCKSSRRQRQLFVK